MLDKNTIRLESMEHKTAVLSVNRGWYSQMHLIVSQTSHVAMDGWLSTSWPALDVAEDPAEGGVLSGARLILEGS